MSELVRAHASRRHHQHADNDDDGRPYPHAASAPLQPRTLGPLSLVRSTQVTESKVLTSPCYLLSTDSSYVVSLPTRPFRGSRATPENEALAPERGTERGLHGGLSWLVRSVYESSRSAAPTVSNLSRIYDEEVAQLNLPRRVDALLACPVSRLLPSLSCP